MTYLIEYMPIGVDLDEVLAPLVHHHCSFLNTKYGKSLEEKDFLSYRFWEVYGCTREQAITDFYEFCETEEFRNIEPYPEAMAGVRELASVDSLHVITSRQDFLRKHTIAWIDKYFPGRFSGIDFGNSFNKEGTKTRKRELCARNNIWLLIEDNATYAREVAVYIPVILVDRPWNQGVYDITIRRAHSWREIVDISRELKADKL